MTSRGRYVGNWLVMVITYNLIVLYWSTVHIYGGDLYLFIDDSLVAIGPLLTLSMCWRGLSGKRKSGWARSQWAVFLLGLGIVSNAVGDILWTVYESIVHTTTTPSWADVFYLAAYPLLSAGMLCLVIRPLSSTVSLRVVLDTAMSLTAMATFGWYLVLGPLVMRGHGSVLARTVDVAYGLGDLILILSLVLLWPRVGTSMRRMVMPFLAIGGACIVLADSGFETGLLQGTYVSGGPLDTLWPLGFMLIGLAGGVLSLLRSDEIGTEASNQNTEKIATTIPQDARAIASFRFTAGSYMFPLLVAIVMIYAWQTPGDASYRWGVYVGGGLMMLLIGIRQFVVILENRAIYTRLSRAFLHQQQDLARRVAELESLQQISQQLNATTTTTEALNVVYNGIRAGLGYDRAGIDLIDSVAEMLVEVRGTDAAGHPTYPLDRRLPLTSDSPFWRVPGMVNLMRGERFFFMENATEAHPPDLRYMLDGAATQVLIVPLRAGGQLTGIISADNLLSGRPVSPIDADPLMALANHASTAIERSRLREKEKAERDRLSLMATTDSLTGLPNRALLNDRLEQALHRARRDHANVSLMLMDLNHFKEVNDTLGHHAGDVLLSNVAGRLRTTVRAADTVARLGGDEFAILLPDTNLAGAEHAARSLLAALDAPVTIDEQTITPTASVGIAVSPDHGQDAVTLLRCADMAMYTAKRTQSGYSIYLADDNVHQPQRLALMSALRQALSAGNLELQYQPTIEIHSGRVVGVEALARWSHPIFGSVPPDVFIPLTEHMNLIGPLTDWVLEEALRQCQLWDDANNLRVGMAVNLSMRTLHNPRFPQLLDDFLRRYPLAPERLTLEITESALMVNRGQVMETLTQLYRSGVRIAIDDFGTGYSSLGYLQKLPAHSVKIDRSFIQGLGATSSLKERAIVRSIIVMAQALGLEVVAEGVETEETWTILATLGCDTAQGYYLCQPLSPSNLPRWVAQSITRN